MKKFMIIVEDLITGSVVPGGQALEPLDFGRSEKADVLQQGEHLQMYRRRIYQDGTEIGCAYYGVSLYQTHDDNEPVVREVVRRALASN